jgi:hypothetical protein
MKRCGVLLLIALVAVLALPSFGREPMTLSVVQQKATADAATPDGQAYLKEFFTNPWMLALDAADGQCRAAQVGSEVPQEFVLALVIADNGYPTDALVSPENSGLKCVADRLKATGFIKPPHDGFAIYMPFKATEPGTEHRQPKLVPATESNR